MFNERQDPLKWAENRGILRYCYKHKIAFDPMIGCPECKKERRPDVFKNIIWLKDDKK